MKSSKVSVCKRFEFAYAHQLPGYQGKCRALHGHTGVVEIELSGVRGVLPYPGMTVDFYDIKRHFGPIVEMLDHKDLNEVLNATQGFAEFLAESCPEEQRSIADAEGGSVIPPTAENILFWLLLMLERHWPQAELVRLRFWESPSSYAEWRA